MEHSQQLAQDHTAVIRTDDISREERLVLYIFRRWVCGIAARDTRQWEMAWRELSAALGSQQARPVLSGLEKLLRETAGYAERSLHYHPPCCGLLAPDEQAMLQIIAGAQQQDLIGSETIARGFVSEVGIGRVIAAAREMGDALSAAGLDLPQRARSAPDNLVELSHYRDRRRTLH